MNGPKVFISYSHDSAEHSERVLNFAWALRRDGIDAELDQFHNEEIVDWPRWCNEQISRERSDFVLCVCTSEYKQRIEGRVPPEKGKGVYWEGSLLDDDVYDEKGNRRIVAVLFDYESYASIPRFLRGWSHCQVESFNFEDSGYEHLFRILTRQTRVEKNKLGKLPELPTRRPHSDPDAPSADDGAMRQSSSDETTLEKIHDRLRTDNSVSGAQKIERIRQIADGRSKAAKKHLNEIAQGHKFYSQAEIQGALSALQNLAEGKPNFDLMQQVEAKNPAYKLSEVGSVFLAMQMMFWERPGTTIHQGAFDALLKMAGGKKES